MNSFGIDWMTLSVGVFIGLVIGNARIRTMVINFIRQSQGKAPVKMRQQETNSNRPSANYPVAYKGKTNTPGGMAYFVYDLQGNQQWVEKDMWDKAEVTR